jgi:hypothetical protein
MLSKKYDDNFNGFRRHPGVDDSAGEAQKENRVRLERKTGRIREKLRERQKPSLAERAEDAENTYFFHCRRRVGNEKAARRFEEKI